MTEEYGDYTVEKKEDGSVFLNGKAVKTIKVYDEAMTRVSVVYLDGTREKFEEYLCDNDLYVVAHMIERWLNEKEVQ